MEAQPSSQTSANTIASQDSIDSLCDPCKFRCSTNKTPAVRYCKICNEPLCKTCSDVHQSSKATRKHLLVNMSDIRKTTTIGKDMETFQKCPHHSGKELEYFCFSRGALYCTYCLFNHSKEIDFDTLCDIAVAGDTLMENKFDQIILKDIGNVIDKCKEEEANIIIQKQRCLNNRQDLVKQLNEEKKNILDVFEKYEKQILDKATEVEGAQMKSLDAELKTIVDTSTAFQDNTDMLQSVIKTDSREDFFRCIISVIKQIDELNSKPLKDSSDRILCKIKYSPAMLSFLKDITPAMTCELQKTTQDPQWFPSFTANKHLFIEVIKNAVVKLKSNETSESSLSSADGDCEDTGNIKQTSTRYKFKTDQVSKSATDNVKNIGIDMKVNALEIVQNMRDGKDDMSRECINSDDKHKNELSGETPTVGKPFGSDIQVINLATVQIPVQNHCNIQGIATLPDGRIVLTDRHESKLFLLNSNFTFLESIKLKSPPGKVAVPNEKYLAICMSDSFRVAICYIKPELRWIRNCVTSNKPMDISTVYDDKLLVSFLDENMSWNLRVLSDEGKVLRTIGRDFMDVSMIACHSFKVSNKYLYIQCCKKSKHLYCFDEDGNDYFRYSVDCPSGICVDKEGMIYVIESTGKLHVLSRDGQLVILKDTEKNATGISYNSSNNRLIIVRNQFLNFIVFEVKK